MSSLSNAKPLQVRKLRRIGEHPKRQKAGNLAKAVEIAGELEVGLRSNMDVDRAKQQDFGWRAGRKSLRDRLSAADGGDLILTQSDVLPKECLQGQDSTEKSRAMRPQPSWPAIRQQV